MTASLRLCAAFMLLLSVAPVVAQTTQPQVWTTNVVTGEFPSQQAAITAVRAQGGVYALAEQVERFFQTGTGDTNVTSFVYGAKKGPSLGAWTYGMSSTTYSSEDAYVEAIEQDWATSCPQQPVVTPTEDWYAWLIWYSGDNYREARYYNVKHFAPPECVASNTPVQGWRNRAVDCPVNTAWSSAEGACVRHDVAIVKTKPPGCACDPLHNPVSASTGDKIQTEADFALPWLTFSRSYHSAYSVPEARMGPGWTHDFNVRMYRLQQGDVAVLLPTGKILPFKWITDRYEAIDGSGWRVLIVDSWNQIYSLEKPDQSVTFDGSGKPTKISNLAGDSFTLQYDNVNRLATVIHSSGRRLTFDYQSISPGAAQITGIKQDGIVLVSYEYDSSGRLEYARYPDGTAKRYHYENASFPNHLTGISDENNARFATYGYNADGLATLSEHAGGLYHGTFNYLADGTTSYTDANGRVQVFAFTADNPYRKIATSADSEGVVTTTFATASNDFRRRPLSRIDKRGVQTTYAYSDYTDATLGDVRKTTTTEAVGTPQSRVTEEWRDRVAGRVLKATQPGTVALYQRNSRGQAASLTTTDTATSLSRSSTSTYCEQADVTAGTCPLVGLVTSLNGPRTDVSDITTVTYYASDDATCASAPATCPHRKGDLWKMTDALGHITETLKYDGAGRVLSVKDANNVVTDFEYHARGWLTARKVRGTDNAVETDDQITRIEYYPTGLVKKTTLPDGSYTSYTYDAAHRLTDITDGAGNTIHYTLDNAGNRTKEDTKDSANAVVRTLSRVYNQLGQLQTHKDAYNHATDYVYDANGNADTVTDALSRVSDNTYDPLNRLTQTIQDLGGLNVTTQFQYDARDNLTAVVDPKGLTTGYTYNSLGDLTQLSSPDTGVTAYTYDSAGNRASQTDARNVTASYGYDVLNRITSVSYPDTSLNVGYSYDTVASACTSGETFAVGRLSQITDGSGSTQYCYDRFGNMVRKVQTTAGQSLTVRYAYTQAGQISSVTYPDGTVADYVRDAQGRTTEIGVTRPGQARQILLTSASYHPFGPVAEWVFGNGRLFQRTLNQNYQPGVVQDQSAGGLSVGYEFDAVGNLSKLRNGDQNDPPLRIYGYDALNRLTSAQDGTTQAFTEGYAYDATGNRTSATVGSTTTAYTYPTTSHRLTDVGGTARSYDNVGNTTAIGGTAREFVYNDANRMSAVKQNGVTAMSYAYNGKGEQVRRNGASTDTVTVYDEAGHWLGEYDNSGAPEQQVIWVDDLPVGLVTGSTVTNQPLNYIEADALGTPRTIIESQRNVVVWSWPLNGEAFGADLPVEDADGDGMGLVFNLRFPGQRYDAVSGLNQNYFRDYDVGGGRYVESDPIGLSGGISGYAYVGGNPLSFADEYGLARFGGKTGQWWQFSNRDFQRWYHLCIKVEGDPDATREQLTEAYEEWVRNGKPDGKNGCGGPPPPPVECPTEESSFWRAPSSDEQSSAVKTIVIGAGVLILFVLGALTGVGA
ncbi:RHS repeat-associated core domain-containing protein [Lysobacter terrae]